MQVDYSVFHAKWSNIQQLNFLPPQLCYFSYTSNSGAAEFNGFDMSLHGKITDGATAGVNLGYVNAYFSQSVFTPAGQLIQEGDKVGVTPQVNAPWNVNAWADYAFALSHGDTLTLRGEYKWLSHNPGPYMTNINSNQQAGCTQAANCLPNIAADPAYAVTNARLTYKKDRVEAGLYVENLFDSHPMLQMNNEANGVPFYTFSTIVPRTVGLTVDYQF
jgi:iron complex outermembrane receptor protein